MVEMFIFYFQFDGKLNGSLNSSYVEYERHLVDDCLRGPSHGCSRTISLCLNMKESLFFLVLKRVMTTPQVSYSTLGVDVFVSATRLITIFLMMTMLIDARVAVRQR